MACWLPRLSAPRGAAEAPDGSERDTPAQQEKREKRGGHRDERGSRALPGKHPYQHASPGRTDPGAEASGPEGERTPPGPDRGQPDSQACEEGPGSVPDARRGVPVTVSVPAYRDEYQHAARVCGGSYCERAGSMSRPWHDYRPRRLDRSEVSRPPGSSSALSLRNSGSLGYIASSA